MVSDVEEITEKTISKGGILAKLYFDMQGEKGEELQPLMADLINNRLLKSPGVVYCFGSIEEPIMIEGYFSTSAAITTLFKDLGAAINVVFNFAPIGIEVLKPSGEYSVKTSNLQSILIDLSNISTNYSTYIMNNVLSPDEKTRLEEEVKRRKALGNHMLDKHGKES
jgi:hypothetical protein